MELVKLRKQEVRTEPYKVIFFSNDPDLPTGYAKIVREIGKRLAKDPMFEVFVVSEHYTGEPKKHELGFTVLPTNRKDYAKYLDYGMKQVGGDVAIVLEDSFTLANFEFHNKLRNRDWKMIFYLPLDGAYTPSTGLPVLRIMDKIVSMAKFTQDEVYKDGFESDMIWHGVDLHLFHPISDKDKEELRKKFGFKKDDFIIFNYGRNNNLRKCNQRMLDILCSWLDKKDDTHKAICHMMPWEHVDNNLVDFLTRHMYRKFKKHFLGKQIMFLDEGRSFGGGKTMTDGEVAELFNISDIVVTASSGEGFGLIMAEAMACGVPVVSTNYTTPKELLIDKYDSVIGERGIVVGLDSVNVSALNTEHALVNVDEFVDAIEKLYCDKKERKRLGENGRLFAEKYLNWDYLVEEWKRVIKEVV